MSDIKWIKVAVDMFEDSKIDFIRSLPEGDAIIVTWIQMLAIAGKSNMGGYLMVADGIPYTEQLLSDKLRRKPTILQFALETLSKLKMIDIEDGPYHITKWEKHQNVEGMEKVRLQTNERVKKHRDKEKTKLETLPSNATVTLQVTQCNATELELDLELDLSSKPLAHSNECAITFETFWNAYPNKKGKAKAAVKWRTYFKTGKINIQKIMSGLESYLKFVEHERNVRKFDRQYLDGLTFVNGERWNDEWSPSTVVQFKQQEKQDKEVEPYFRSVSGEDNH